jgi:hypothetical protein
LRVRGWHNSLSNSSINEVIRFQPSVIRYTIDCQVGFVIVFF